MNDLPDPDMQPEDADKLISSYRRPIDPARKTKLMDKLKGQKQVFEKDQKVKRDMFKENGKADENSR